MACPKDTDTTLSDSTQLLNRPAALRERGEKEGLLFFRGLLPRDEVLELRRDFLGVLERAGLLDTRHDRMAGMIDAAAMAALSPEKLSFCGGVPREIYADIQRLESFHAMAHHPRLLQLYRSLFGREVLPHPRNIARIMLPGPHVAPTPAHQDHVHVQGTRNTWTCWFPVGDCPVALGGLAVLPQSHRDGILRGHESSGAGNFEVEVCDPTLRYLTTDFQAGDVLTFPSLTVHKAVPPTLKDRVRLSCDFRYQPVEEPVEEKSLEVHCDTLTWEEVYADWQGHEDLKYYWRRGVLHLSPWNEDLKWQPEKIC